MKPSRDEASWARPALDQRGYLGANCVPNRFGKTICMTDILLNRVRCQGLAGRNLGRGPSAEADSGFGTNGPTASGKTRACRCHGCWMRPLSCSPLDGAKDVRVRWPVHRSTTNADLSACTNIQD